MVIEPRIFVSKSVPGVDLPIENYQDRPINMGGDQLISFPFYFD